MRFVERGFAAEVALLGLGTVFVAVGIFGIWNQRSFGLPVSWMGPAFVTLGGMFACAGLIKACMARVIVWNTASGNVREDHRVFGFVLRTRTSTDRAVVRLHGIELGQRYFSWRPWAGVAIALHWGEGRRRCTLFMTTSRTEAQNYVDSLPLNARKNYAGQGDYIVALV